MVRRLFKTGNSMVVSLPKDVLEPLGIIEGADLQVELDREKRQIIIRPVEQPIAAAIDTEFARQVADFIEEYRPALDALAKKG